MRRPHDPDWYLPDVLAVWDVEWGVLASVFPVSTFSNTDIFLLKNSSLSRRRAREFLERRYWKNVRVLLFWHQKITGRTGDFLIVLYL